MKKITGIAMVIGLCSLVVIKLMSNKNQMEQELKAMQKFNEAVPVEVVEVAHKEIDKKLIETGVFYSKSDVQVISQTEGKIRSLKKEVGSKITKGQILATVEKEVLESRLWLAEETLAKAEKDLNRYKRLVGGEAVTEQQLEEAKLNYQNALTHHLTLREQLDNTEINAPIDGTISEQLIENGAYISPGEHLFTISDQSKMIFQTKVTGSDLPLISAGQPTKLFAHDLPGQDFQGKVKHVDVIADLAGRYVVEVEVPNPGYVLRAGMTGSASFLIPATQKQLIIPRKSIDGSMYEPYVFVLEGEKVRQQKIIAESIDNHWVSVISGLQSGDRVVTSGQINLRDGSKVNVISNYQEIVQK